MSNNKFHVFRELTNETNESVFNHLMELSKQNLDLAIEKYFNLPENISSKTLKRHSPCHSSGYTFLYLGKLMTEAISLTFLNKIPSEKRFYCKITKARPKKKEDIDKSLRLSLDPDGISVAKINYSLSEKLFPLFLADLIKLEVINVKELRVNTLDNFQIIVSVFLNPEIFSDPALNTNEEAGLKKVSMDVYCAQREAFKVMVSLLNLKKTQTALISKESPEQGDEVELSECEKSQCLNHFDEVDLPETVPSGTFRSELLRYQAQALTWMIERETKKEFSSSQLHHLWEEYTVESGQKIFINSCTGQVSVKFPSAGAFCKGGILADEMGLGKTVMTIALIHSNRIPQRQACKQVKKANPGGTLIIVPLSLVSQWRNELDSHGDSLTILEFYEGKTRSLSEVRKADVVITTYGIINSESSKKQGLLWDMSWFRIILDEAHTIRNRNTITAKSIYSLKAEHKWVLTGTPIQNTVDDLFSLVRFLEYEPWNDYMWWNKTVTRKFHKKNPDCFAVLHRMLKPIMLRRTKASKQEDGKPIVTLPRMEVREVRLQLPEAEQREYKELVSLAKNKYKSLVSGGMKTYVTCVFELLLRLRQYCDHPLLIRSRSKVESPDLIEAFLGKFKKADNEKYINSLIETLKSGLETDCPICLDPTEDSVITKCLHILCRNCALIQISKNHNCPLCKSHLNTSDLQTLPRASKFSLSLSDHYSESVKISFLLSVLSEDSSKTVVFTQWVGMLDILEIALKRAGISYSRVDGGLNRSQRESSIQEFKSTTRVLIMSLKAGCQGLNLTCATQIVILDPWWNPAIEKQAIERVHRIGQTKDVKAFRVICEGTIEEQVVELQKVKEQINEGAFIEQTCSLNLENIRKIFDAL